MAVNESRAALSDFITMKPMTAQHIYYEIFQSVILMMK